MPSDRLRAVLARRVRRGSTAAGGDQNEPHPGRPPLREIPNEDSAAQTRRKDVRQHEALSGTSRDNFIDAKTAFPQLRLRSYTFERLKYNTAFLTLSHLLMYAA